MRAARWMGVAPWETLEPAEADRVPRRLWRVWAGICEAAELEAREAAQRA